MPNLMSLAAASKSVLSGRAPGEDVLRRQVLQLALPAIGERLLSMMVGIVDTMLVGHLGASALAAVSLANEWVFAVTILNWAVATGATALVARSVGARDMTTANGTLGQSLLIGALVGLSALVLGVLLAQPAIALMGAEPEALTDGATYLRLVALVFPLSALMYVGNACLRGAGDTRTPMMVMAIVNVLNIAVAWTAINGPFGLPRLGVTGSALGAVTGNASGGLLVLGLLLKGRSGLKLEPKGFRPDTELMRRVLHVGVPTGVEQMSWRIGTMVFVRAVASLGTIAVASHAVAVRAESFSFMPGAGFAVAGTTMVGQSLGAGDARRAERCGYISFQLAGMVMTLMGLAFVLIPGQFIRLFTNDPAVIETAATPLRITGAVQPLLAAAIVFPGCLRGAGDTRFPMVLNLISIWAIRVPVALFLGRTLGLGLAGAWIGIALDVAARGIVTFIRFRGGRWKLIQL